MAVRAHYVLIVGASFAPLHLLLGWVGWSVLGCDADHFRPLTRLSLNHQWCKNVFITLPCTTLHTPHSGDPQFWYQSKQYLEKAPNNTGPQVSKFHVECVETICLPKILDRSFLLGTYLNILYSSKYRCQRWGTLQHTHEGRNKQMAMKGKKNAAESWTVLTSHLNCSLHVGVQDRLYLAVSIHNMFWLDTL